MDEFSPCICQRASLQILQGSSRGYGDEGSMFFQPYRTQNSSKLGASKLLHLMERNKMMASWLQTLRFKMHWSVIYMCSGAPVLPWKNIMKRPKLAMLGQILLILGQILLILVQLYYSCTTRCTCCRLVLHRKRWQLLRATRIHLRSRAGGTPGLGLDTGHQWFPKVSGSCEQCSKPLLVDDYRGLYYPIYWGF